MQARAGFFLQRVQQQVQKPYAAHAAQQRQAHQQRARHLERLRDQIEYRYAQNYACGKGQKITDGAGGFSADKQPDGAAQACPDYADHTGKNENFNQGAPSFGAE